MTNILEPLDLPTIKPWKLGETDYHIPKWLFRTWSPGSNGDNSATTFISPAFGNGKTITTLDGFTPSRRKDVIEGHARWWNLPHDPLISLSSSLIFVLQHGIFKIANPRHEYDVSRHTYLTMIDSKGIEDAFVPMIKLLQDNRLDEKTDRSLCLDYYSHEYAAQKFLVHVGHSVTFSFQQLADAGLFQIFDEFKNPDMFNQLCGRWVQLSIGDWFGVSWRTTRQEKVVIEKLVAEIEPRYRFMVALNVLSMKTRSVHDRLLQHMLEGYHADSGAFALDEQPLIPEHIATVEMQGAYRIANLMRTLEQKVPKLSTTPSISELNVFMSVHEGLEHLIQSGGAVFEAILQDTGSGSVTRPLGRPVGLPSVQPKPASGSSIVPGLITPPPSRRPTADGLLVSLSSEIGA